MGRLKKDIKTKDKMIVLPRKKEKPETTKHGNSLRLVEMSDEELKRLRVDVYPYLM